jgi:ABC-type multidrug transport system fused ATPase/permease subunit
MGSEFENYMTSSQQINGYTKMPSEGNLIEPADKDLAENWPLKGAIEFKDVTMSYRPGLEPCLRKLSFKAQAGMKIGIVGRTGAGKSSILQALFRLCDLSEGSMLIDDYDCKDLGLHTLRKNVAFIPQSPFLL